MITQITDKEIAQAAEIESLRQEVTAWSVTAENLEAERDALEETNVKHRELLVIHLAKFDELTSKNEGLRAALKAAESGPLSDEAFDIVTSENSVLKAKLAAAETSANELRRAVAELIGADPETWPNHGNAPLAIAAYVAAQHAELTALESKLAALEVLYLNSLADATQWQLYKSRKDAVIAAGMGKKVMRDSAAGAVPTSQKPVAEVLLVDGEKVIDASMAFFDSVELGTKLYLAAGAAPVPNAELAEALEDLMSWQVKNVKRWHNSAYDNAARVLQKLEAGAAPAKEPDDQIPGLGSDESAACAKVCDVTPPYPFRPSIEAAHAIRARGTT